jgi:hypothetical protein
VTLLPPRIGFKVNEIQQQLSLLKTDLDQVSWGHEEPNTIGLCNSKAFAGSLLYKLNEDLSIPHYYLQMQPFKISLQPIKVI